MKAAICLPAIIFFSMLTLPACKKRVCQEDEAIMTNAVITGYDLRKCSCCGGLMLNMGDDTTLYAEGFYLIDGPLPLPCPDSDQFPMRVRIRWEASSKPVCGANQRIKINEIACR